MCKKKKGGRDDLVQVRGTVWNGAAKETSRYVIIVRGRNSYLLAL